VRATFDNSGVIIGVHDAERLFAGLTRPQNPLLGESARGSAIVSRLADRLELESIHRGGCCVRARQAVRL
jgi:hypothetical protein